MDNSFDEYFVQEKTGIDRLLDFLVFLAVFAVTIFLLLEIFSETGKTSIDFDSLSGIYFYVNIVVFIIFFADLIRLWIESNGPKDFFMHNWLDVLATIPFGLIANGLVTFEVLKLARLTKLLRVQKISRISKISKEFKAASHLKKEGDEYRRKHRL
ncbi:MAG: hypothetical protein PF569_04210 [Candidatus Woesearchaeota archaeon]|jgi:hypothetical protein|nr:hypothetical protein [Candidatus Woesearchaeota archaeon]